MRGGESRVLNRVQSINRGMTMAEFYGIDEVFTVEESIPAVLDKYEDVFDWSEKLHLRREIDQIHLKRGLILLMCCPTGIRTNKKKRWKS